MTLVELFTGIANAIRNKKGTTETIKAIDFATEIESISSGGDASEYFGEYVSGGMQSAIKKLPPIDVTGTTNLTDLFNNFVSLIEVPNIDTSNATNFSKMFYKCSSLTTIPLLNTSNATSMSQMFFGCSGLVNIPLLDTPKVTMMTSMFSGCTSITTIPLLDTSKVTNMSQAFNGCSSVTDIPKLDASKLTNISDIFYNCRSLTNFGGFENLGMAYGTNASGYNNYKLNLEPCINLTHDSLMNVINNLYDIRAKGCNRQILNLGTTNRAKLTDEEVAIATNKGWNVT